MTANAALERNASMSNAPPPSEANNRRLTLKQEMIRNEFIVAYAIRLEQIWFDGESDQPYFDFEALMILVNKLSDIPVINVEPGPIDLNIGIFTSTCEITLSTGMTRRVPGHAMLGEAMPGGETIEDVKQGLDVAGARALRKALRVVSFDPVKAHEARKHGEDLPLQITDPRQAELAEAHILGEELELIQGTDKNRWRQQINLYFPGKDSASQLGSAELAQFIVYLRSIKHARERGLDVLKSSASGAGR